MLLKYSQAQKRIKTAAGIGKPQRTAGGMVKLTSGLMTVAPKIHRKVIKVASKRPASVHRTPTAVKREQIPLEPCENSNDSGLGFDHNIDYHHPTHPLASHHSALRFSEKEVVWQTEESQEVKRRRLEIKLESDDANDNFTFPERLRQPVPRTVCMPVRPRRVVPVTLSSQLSATSHNGLVQLVIACQPETQHRARYQTEGSRGAVKDRSGNGFPVVKLVGYDRPATLQVFIGTDQGRVAPHMFYQACRVSGKNSTPCVEKKIDGTIVIEVDIEPSKEMLVTCDCVGILKERNVDVEHRFPEEGSGRSKKKSTRCRMVFRTTITNPDGSQETLQVTSQPIVCTQPPGVPEICKKSLSSCSVRGGQELFVLGKNFLKDTRVVFQEGDSASPSWSQSVQPDKEFLQQSHLVCVVPAYHNTNITEPVTVRLIIESSGKSSEPHTFMYVPDSMNLPTPVAQTSDSHTVLDQEGNIGVSSVVTSGGIPGVFRTSHIAPPRLMLPSESEAPMFMAPPPAARVDEKTPIHPVMMWNKHMMPPPPAGMPLPMTMRRSSVQLIVPDPLPPENLKTEMPDSLEEHKPLSNVADLSSTKPPSMDTFCRFVSNSSLPSLNVGNYLSNIENKSAYSKHLMNAQMMNEIPQIMIGPPTPINNTILKHEASNLLTTVQPVLMNPPPNVTFEGRNLSVDQSTSHSLQDNLSVIVNPAMLQKKSPNLSLESSGMPEPQNVGINSIISTTVHQSEPTMTEKLDAFVNSTADSHISPTPVSPTPLNCIVPESSSVKSMLEENNVNKIQETFPAPMQTNVGPINLSSSHQDTSSMIDQSVCQVLRPSNSESKSPMECFPQTAVGNQLIDQNLSTHQTNTMHSPTQHSINQREVFSKVQVSLEEQILSSQPVVTSQMNHEFLMQPQTLSNSSPSVSAIQSSLDQVSSHIMNTNEQLSQSEINSLLKSTGNPIVQVQSLSNFQATVDQQLSSQAVSTNEISTCSLDNIINSSVPVSSAEVQAINNIQATLENQFPSQNSSSPHSEHAHEIESSLNQQSNLLVGNLTSPIQRSSETSVDNQAFNTFQTSFEHLKSQMNHKTTFQNEPMKVNSLDLEGSKNIREVPTQTVREAFPTFQTSLDHHMSPQMSCHSTHETGCSGLDGISSTVSHPTSPLQVTATQTQVFSHIEQHLPNQQSVMATLPPNSLNSPVDIPEVVANQAQTLSDIEMSLKHLSPQTTTSQEDMASVTSNTLSLGTADHDNPQIHVALNEGAQVLTNFSASLGHLAPGDISSSQVNCLERHSPVQINSLETSLQSSPNQATLNHFPSQPTVENGHLELLPPNNYPSKGSPNNSEMLSSPTSHQTTPLILAHSEVGMSPGLSLPTSVSLSQSSLDPQALKPPSIILNTSQNLGTEPTSTLSTAELEFQMRSAQNTVHFRAMSAVQETAMSQYDQSSCNDSGRPTADPFVARAQTVTSQSQGSTQTVRKCEEGMSSMPTEITQMSENDLIRYINPSCFDTV